MKPDLGGISRKTIQNVPLPVFLGALGVFLFAAFLFQNGQSSVQSPFLLGEAAASQRTGSQEGQLAFLRAPFLEAPELVLVSSNALSATSPPVTVTPKVLGAIMGKLEEDRGPDIIKYEVEEGDTIASLAEKFGISQDTIFWANDLPQGSSLKPGKQLLILSVSGALHLVRPGDTLSEIAKWYKGNAQDILEANSISSSDELFAGDLVVIPGGVKPKDLPSGRLTLVANSYFIYPIPTPHRRTQGLHPFNAVDLSNGTCGEPVYAAAGGQVQRTGYTSLGGNYIRILHPNGIVTYYGHLSRSLAASGLSVSQGQTIGYTGNTGYTLGPSGCHLHFEVRGAVNPFAR